MTNQTKPKMTREELKQAVRTQLYGLAVNAYNSNSDGLPEYAQISTDDVMVLIDQYHSEQVEEAVVEARKEEMVKLAEQCDYVAEVFKSTIQKEKVTLESIAYYARDRIKQLQSTTNKERGK